MSSFASKQTISRDYSNASSSDMTTPTYNNNNNRSNKSKRQYSNEEEIDLNELQRGK